MTYLKQPHIHIEKIDREDINPETRWRSISAACHFSTQLNLVARAEVSEYLGTFIKKNDFKGLAVLSNTNMSSWNLTLMQGFTNNVIKNVIIVVLPFFIHTTFFIFFW